MRLTKNMSIETRATIAIFEFLETSKKLSVLLNHGNSIISMIKQNKKIKLANLNYNPALMWIYLQKQ